MAELAGLLLGVTGPVQQAVDILKDLKERRDAVRNDKAEIDALHEQFTRLSRIVNEINQANIDDVTDNVRRMHLQDMKERVSNIVARTIENLQEVKSYAASRWNRFRSAKKHAGLIGAVQRDAATCSDTLSQIIGLLGQVETSSDGFRASFAVPRNTKIIQHDFDTTCADGTYATAEGRLKQMILSRDNGSAVGAVAVGTGGVGKTCTLRAIVQRDDVQKRFPGGTYFYSLGKDAHEADVIKMLVDFVRCSNGGELASKMKVEKDLHGVISDACNWFNGKVCLFVVDDIWNNPSMPFTILQDLSRLAGRSNDGRASSRIAYSTRDKDIYNSAGGSIVEFKPLEPLGAPARSILFAAAELDEKHALSKSLGRYVTDILRVCAGLQFTLNLVGRLIHKVQRSFGDQVGEKTLRAVCDTVNSKEILNRRGESYFALLEASIEYLDSTSVAAVSHKQAIEAFCVLRKQDWVPISVCHHMWRTSCLSAAEQIMENLSTLGIIEMERDKDSAILGMRFHDHVHTYSEWLAGQSSDSTHCFKNVVESCRISFGSQPDGTCWPALLEEDGYVVQNICRIMLRAEKTDEVGETLRSGQWVTKMMVTGQILQYDRDVSDWEMAVQHSGRQAYREMSSALFLLSRVIRLGHPHCVGSPQTAWFQLYARLKAVASPKQWMLDVMRESEVRAPRPFVQAKSRCLHSPLGALQEVNSFQFSVHDVQMRSDGTIGVYGFEIVKEVPMIGLVGADKSVSAVEMRMESNIEYEFVKTATCFTGDGTRLFYGSKQGDIIILDAATGEPIDVWRKCHNAKVNSICISTDGLRVASGSQDKTVRVWDVESGAVVCDALTGHTDWVQSVSMSADGSRVASGSVDKTVRVWDVESGAVVCDALTGHAGFVWSVSMSADGSRVASGSVDKTVRVWDVESGSAVCEVLTGHTDAVESVSMSADGSRVASQDYREMRLWLSDSGKCARVLDCPNYECRSLANVAARECLDRSGVSAGQQTLCVWVSGPRLVSRDNSSAGRQLAVFDSDIQVFCVSEDGAVVAAGLQDGNVAILHIHT